MKRTPLLNVLWCAATVVSGESVLHWLMGRGMLHSLFAAFYMSRDFHGKAADGFLLTTMLPAVVLGIVAAWVANPQWRRRVLVLTGLGIAVLVTATVPFDYLLLGPIRGTIAAGTPRGHGEWALFLFVNFYGASATAIAFAGGVHVARRDWTSSRERHARLESIRNAQTKS